MHVTRYNADAPYETNEYEYNNIVFQYESGLLYEQPDTPYGGYGPVTTTSDGYSYVWHLNRLAGSLDAFNVPTLAEAAAANKYAGTTGLDTVGALNWAAGIRNPALFLDFQGILNELAGTTGLGPNAAAARITE